MEDKTKLIAAAKKTFLTYLKLDFAREFKLTFEGAKECTLAEYLESIVDKKNPLEDVKHSCKINGVAYTITIKADGTTTLKPTLPVSAKETEISIKDIKDYNDEETLKLLSNAKFFLQRNKHGNIALGLSLSVQDKEYVLGGEKKLDLYRSHLVTLNKMINHLEKGGDLKAMLVALTTGSGKTFLQCLWFLTLQLAGTNGVFALPDNLVNQFKKDFKRLLPDEMVNQILEMRENRPASNRDAVNAIKNLPKSGSSNKQKKPVFVVASYEELLKNNFNDLFDADPNLLSLIFDEQHKVMSEEINSVKLKELAKKFLSLFLTATPDKETFDMSAVVAVMSAAQKKREGIGEFPIIKKIRTKTLRNQMKKIKGKSFVERFFGPLLLKFANAIEPEAASPIMKAFDKLRHTVLCDDDNPENHRANLQMPVKRKMLVQTDNVDELAAIHNYLNGDDRVYVEGNMRNRDGVYQFFNIRNADEEIRDANKKRMSEKFTQKLDRLNVDGDVKREPRPFRVQLRFNIYHNLINLFLSDLTGLSVIELNKMRQEDPEKLYRLVDEGYQKIEESKIFYDTHWYDKLQYDEKERPSGIDSSRADRVAKIMQNIFDEYQQYRIFSEEKKKKLIDNWEFDEVFHYGTVSEDGEIEEKGLIDTIDCADFVIEHEALFLMKGMKNAEIPIKDSVPFLGFKRKWYRLYDENGMLYKDAKKIKRTPLQVLDDYTLEYVYKPKYDENIDEVIADNLFKLGLVGMYVSNKKTEGFNDLNLHTVINTIPNSADTNNDPANMIQSIRMRGLDPTVREFYLQTLGLHTKRTFDLSLLEVTEDYYPKYFASDKKFKKIYLKQLAHKVISEIKEWYHKNLNHEHDVDPVKLKWQTMRRIVDALRLINNKHSHNIKLSRKHLTGLLSEIHKKIKTEIKDLKQPYRLGAFVRFVGWIMNIIVRIYYFFKNYKVNAKFGRMYAKKRRELKRAKKSGAENNTIDKLTAEVTYGKIITKLSFTNLIHESIVANEFKQLLMREKTTINKMLTENFQNYISNKIDKSTLSPLELFNTKTYDIEKLTDFIGERVKSIIMHPRFSKIMQRVFGVFDRDEVRMLIKVVSPDTKDLDQTADDLLDLFQKLRKRDFDGIQKLYLTVSTSDDSIIQAAENIKLIKMVQLIGELFKELIDTQGRYHCMDARGELEPNHESRLFNYILGRKNKTDRETEEKGKNAEGEPDEKKEENIDNEFLKLQTNSKESHFSRVAHKVFYIRGLLNGLPDSGKISAFANKNMIDNLTRVNDKIISPLWWSANRTAAARKISKGWRSFASAFKPKPKKQNGDAKAQRVVSSKERNDRYEKSAYDIGDMISQLERFQLSDVKKADCKLDTVQSVFDTVDENLKCDLKAQKVM